MKQLIITLFIAISTSLSAQITFRYAPPVGYIEKATTTSAGEKFIHVPAYNGIQSDTLVIYNSDWSLYRQVILPVGYAYTDLITNNGASSTPSLSDKLFNSDAQLEFLACRTPNTGGSGYPASCAIFDESGNTVFAFPDTVFNSEVVLFTVEDTFMIWYAKNWSSNLGYVNAQIYSLPGSLPCNTCALPSGIIGPTQGGGEMAGLNAYPNPMENTVTIEYNLQSQQEGRLSLMAIDGRELRSIQLSNQSGKLVLATADLPHGIIMANLYGNNSHLISKKLLKIE